MLGSLQSLTLATDRGVYTLQIYSLLVKKMLLASTSGHTVLTELKFVLKMVED